MPCNRTLLDFNRTPRRPLRVILEDLQDLAHPVHIEVLGEVPPLGLTRLADEATVLGTHTEVLDVSEVLFEELAVATGDDVDDVVRVGGELL